MKNDETDLAIEKRKNKHTFTKQPTSGNTSSRNSTEANFANTEAVNIGLQDHPPSFSLDSVKPLDPDKYPNKRIGKSVLMLPTTIPNLIHMLSEYGITVRYDLIRKRLLINIPGLSGCPDNLDNSALAQIISLAALNNLSVGLIPNFVEAIGDRYPINPVAVWITSKPWDGNDRLQTLYNSLVVRTDFPQTLKELLLYRWLLSAVAAVLKPSGFRSRGVLTLQGPQSIGKTAWIWALITDPRLRDTVIKLDHHLDAGNKDSQLIAISHWIVEIGELDSSFKKDIARLKGFITSDRDKVRKPYAKVASEYQRRTVFCATVNDNSFLIDDTGNTRWWTIPVTSINYDHDIDMQQVFAQLAVDFRKGERWWLTDQEEQRLEMLNRDHRSVSVVRERVLSALDLDLTVEKRPAMTATEVLIKAGFERPTNGQCRECGGLLRELIGTPRKIGGLYKWRVPLREFLKTHSFSAKDEEF